MFNFVLFLPRSGHKDLSQNIYSLTSKANHINTQKQRENASSSDNIVYHTGKKKQRSIQCTFLNSNNFTHLLGA